MTEQSAKYKAYLQIGLMFFIVIATLLLGFLMMPDSQEEHDRLLEKLGTTNHGTLLVPVTPINGLSLEDKAGHPWQWQDHKPKWRMLIPTVGRCDGECGELLVSTRQVHVRLGKYTHRLERLLVDIGGELPPAAVETLATEHPYLKIMRSDGDDFRAWLADTNSPWRPNEGKVVLVDPAGTAMMTYDVTHNGNGMLEDLNHLLKYSAD